MHGYSIFSFWISMVLTKIFFSTDGFKPRKNITVFESITAGKSEYLEMRMK